MWEEHIKDVSIACYIIDSATKDYIGYCGIKNISLPKWGIAIELPKSQTGKGIGDLALGNCLNAVKERSDISEFCVRIDSDNYASQKLVEKMGVVPNGTGEFLLYDEEDILKCEEDNLNCIDGLSDKMRIWQCAIGTLNPLSTKANSDTFCEKFSYLTRLLCIGVGFLHHVSL